MKHYKKLLIATLLLFFCVIIFLNLGRFIDVTQKPLKSDIIISLGGDNGCRLETALKLYKEGLSASGKLMYTGREAIGPSYSLSLSKKKYLENNGVQTQGIIHVDKSIITNTMGEVFFIKEYMLRHNLKSVIFVSHPQHSRRISTLAKYVADYNSAGLDFIVASCHPEWWNKEHYYMNELAIKVSIREALKLIYNFIKYNTPLIAYTKYSAQQRSGEWEAALERLN